MHDAAFVLTLSLNMTLGKVSDKQVKKKKRRKNQEDVSLFHRRQGTDVILCFSVWG